MVMHLNFNRSYIKKVYDGEDPDDGASAWRRMSIDTQN